MTVFMGANLTKPVVQEIKTPNCPATTVWILAATFLPHANAIALSTTNHDLLFYTHGTAKFERACRINQLPAAATALTYHCDADNPKVYVQSTVAQQQVPVRRPSYVGSQRKRWPRAHTALWRVTLSIRRIELYLLH